MSRRKNYRKASEAISELGRLRSLYGKFFVEKGMGELMHMSDSEISEYENEIKQGTVILKSAEKALKKDLRKYANAENDISELVNESLNTYENYKNHLSEDAKEKFADTVMQNINDALENSDTNETIEENQKIGSKFISEFDGYISDDEAVRFETLDSFADDAKNLINQNGNPASPLTAQSDMSEFYNRLHNVLQKSNLTRSELSAYDILDLFEDTTNDIYDSVESLYYSGNFKVHIINKNNYAEFQNPLMWARSQDDYIDTYILSNFE